MPKERSKLLPGAAAGSWPAENCNSQISTREKSVLSRRNMGVWTSQNATLLSYLYAAHSSPEVRDGWHALTPGCRIEPLGCHCFHVAGSMLKAKNPMGHKRCAPKDRIMDCTDPMSGPFYIKAKRNCSCFAQSPEPAAPPCLFGDMRPAKLLAIILAVFVLTGKLLMIILALQWHRRPAGLLSLTSARFSGRLPTAY